jgi:anti-sigma regulatory factor (Ser/Thr protein kinase)
VINPKTRHAAPYGIGAHSADMCCGWSGVVMDATASRVWLRSADGGRKWEARIDEVCLAAGVAYRARHGDPLHWTAEEIEVYLDLVSGAARPLMESRMQHYRQELIADPRAFARVRLIVGAYLRYWGWGEIVQPAVMCVTELLSNVRKHAQSDDCTLLIQTSPSGLRIVVSDDSRELPVVREPDWFTESGRGMFLLSKTVDAWGAEPNGSGKDVWLEFHTVASRGVAA